MPLPAFNATKAISTATGPNNELLVVQGGVRGRRWTGNESHALVPLGVDAPTTAPTVITDPTAPAGFYVARVDITKGGRCYNAPPAITFTSTPAIGSVTGGVASKAIGYLNQSSVADIRVQDSGKYYPHAPSVQLSATHGTGAVLTAVLDIPEGAGYDATNDPLTGITQWEIIQAPSYLDEAGETSDQKIWYRSFNGTSNIFATNGTALTNPRPGNYQLGTGENWNAGIVCSSPGASTAELVVTGDVRTGTAAKIKLTFSGARWVCSQFGASIPTYNHWRGARSLLAVSPGKYGSGYDPNTIVVVRIRANIATSNTENDILIYGYPTGNENNTQARGYPIKTITIDNPGSGYTVAPELRIVSKSGFGAVATCTVSNGQITSVKILNHGAGYKTPPTVEILSGGAEAFAVARPHLRGKYLCYYRFIDNTDASYGGPFPSNLSPPAVYDAGNGVSRIRWTTPFPDRTGRPWSVELWRTTSNQALTLYRVATYSTQAAYYTDDLTDDELRNPDRAGYAAMPILLPNGELCANRFTPPPTNKDVVVRFQDRYWYGVDTGGSEPNTLYYSEVDEPESVPDINQVVLQQNAREADRITALAPLNNNLLIFQERHAFVLSFASNPVLDGQVHPVAFRGALNQRCWDIYDGVLYVMDQAGIYALGQDGGIEDLSAPIANLLDDIDLLNAGRNFLVVDQQTLTLRAFVSWKGDLPAYPASPDGLPTRAMCYSLRTKSWFMEKYPQGIRAGVNGKVALAGTAFAPSEVRTIYAAESGIVLLDEGFRDIARGAITSVTLTSRGSGYTSPPAVSASTGCGAEFQAVVNDRGEVTAVVIMNPGRGYSTSGSLTITGGGGGGAAATYTATPPSSDTPTLIPYRMKTGCAPLIDDVDDPKAAGAMSRQIRVQYRPQSVTTPMAVRLYYNNSRAPRPNVAPRARGAGLAFSAIDAAARMDLGSNTIKGGDDDGVASAQLSGRTLDDLNKADRNVAVEVSGGRMAADPVVIYAVEVSGRSG